MNKEDTILIFNINTGDQLAILQSDIRSIYKAEDRVFLHTTWESGTISTSYQIKHTLADALLIWAGKEPMEPVIVK